ncbi:MAG: hypothetical protein E7090_01070 [Bacteroidales bacterium]|nr:hypothetical protein [Bacteroidales bacterium]
MAKIVTNEREISCLLGYFSKRVQTIFAVYGKGSNKRAKNMKFTSIFFTASALLSSMFTSKIVTNEREISSLLGYFSKRVQTIFAVYGKDSNKRARNMKFTSIFFTASVLLSSMFTSKVIKKSI